MKIFGARSSAGVNWITERNASTAAAKSTDLFMVSPPQGLIRIGIFRPIYRGSRTRIVGGGCPGAAGSTSTRASKAATRPDWDASALRRELPVRVLLSNVRNMQVNGRPVFGWSADLTGQKGRTRRRRPRGTAASQSRCQIGARRIKISRQLFGAGKASKLLAASRAPAQGCVAVTPGPSHRFSPSGDRHK